MQESVEQDKAGSADKAERPSGSNTEEEGGGLTTLKAPRRQVVASHPNTAEVVIVHPAPKEHEPERAATDDEVSPSLISRDSDTDLDIGPILSQPVREMLVSGGTVRPIPRDRFDMHSVPRAEGLVQPHPRTLKEEDGRGAGGVGTEEAETDRGMGRDKCAGRAQGEGSRDHCLQIGPVDFGHGAGGGGSSGSSGPGSLICL